MRTEHQRLEALQEHDARPRRQVMRAGHLARAGAQPRAQLVDQPVRLSRHAGRCANLQMSSNSIICQHPGLCNACAIAVYLLGSPNDKLITVQATIGP